MTTKLALAYEDYLAIPNDGLRHEIIDGEHLVSPAPNIYHQYVSRHLQLQLMLNIEIQGLGYILDAPVDVELSDHNIVQPDLVYVSQARRSIMTPTRLRGIPDLVVEILSPSHEARDTVVKRKLYERCGVPEYWIVFPDDHRLLQLVLTDGRYHETQCDSAVVMTVPPQLRVDLLKVW